MREENEVDSRLRSGTIRSTSTFHGIKTVLHGRGLQDALGDDEMARMTVDGRCHDLFSSDVNVVPEVTNAVVPEWPKAFELMRLDRALHQGGVFVPTETDGKKSSWPPSRIRTRCARSRSLVS